MCITIKLKSKMKSIEFEIDGGTLMKAILVTIMMVQMGFPTGICEGRSQTNS